MTALELVDIHKSFPGARAVRGVSLRVEEGQVHALVGENGAGKSTLIKIATGALRPDRGELRVGGHLVGHPTRRAMHALGVRAIYQERQVAPDLSVAENVLLDALPTRFGIVDWRAARRQASARLARLGIDIDPSTPLLRLDVASTQLVEIARAATDDARLVVMDEPTASLHRDEVERLFGVVRSLTAAGTAVLYISHHLDEIFAIADHVTVLRDGEVVASDAALALDVERLTTHMFGRSVSTRPRPAGASEPDGPRSPVVLRARGLDVERRVRKFDLELRAGEVVAITGGMGSGTSEVAMALAGAMRPSAGSVEIVGHGPVRSRRAAARHVAFLPSDRKRRGLLLDKDVAENLLVGLLATRSPAVIGRTWLRRWAAEVAARSTVKAAGVDAPVRTLSGGNQQKVIIGRWLTVGAAALVFDEPTAGVDIAAKFQIYEMIRALAADGVGVVVATTDFQEVGQVADRVLVLRDGRVVAELDGSEATEHRLVEAEFGASMPSAPTEVTV